MKASSWRELRRVYAWGRDLVSPYVWPTRRERWKRFYQPFLSPGDLVFDVGAQAGEQTRAFRDCKARVVALEPQPALFERLTSLYGNDNQVSLHPWGVGRETGSATLFIANENPSFSTFSGEWIDSSLSDERRRGAHWDDSRRVAITTLDHLISLHGTPRFCRISGEGWEPEILEGLSSPLELIAFDHHPAGTQHAVICVEHLEDLGRYCYNIASGPAFVESDWVSAAKIISLLLAPEAQASSTQIYARLLHGYRLSTL